jgi:predicted Fe-Mo cluster-binding NifX family protein
MHKILIPIQGDFVAPRFDLATEILMARVERNQVIGEPKTIIMERPSDEGLCQMVVEENITDVVCGGIEELHYNFLVWKKVTVLDGVIGDWQTALDKAVAGTLLQGEIIPSPNDNQLKL